MGLFSKIHEGNGKETLRPSSRLTQFFYIIKSNLFLVTIVSFISVLFVLPLIGFGLVFFFNLFDLYQKGDAATIFSFGLTNSFLLIPFFMLATIGVCGSHSLFKRMVFAEVYRFSDFWYGIKENWWHFLIIGFVKGLSISLLVFGWLFYGYYTTNSLILVRVLITVQYFLIGMVLMFVATQTVTYNIKIWPKIKNAILLMIARFFGNLLIFTLRAIPLFLLLIFQTQILLILLFVLVFVGGAIYSLLTVERCFKVFDDLMHKDELQQYYRKGLREKTLK